MAFKIINRLKDNNDNFKFNDDFKSHITVGRILKKTSISHQSDLIYHQIGTLIYKRIEVDKFDNQIKDYHQI